MYDRLKEFFRNEDGAITVDWVVLTAGACFFGVVIVGSIQSAVTDKSEGIGADVIQTGTAALEYGTGGG
ncbi:Flp family type IVb pilin [Ovoidimarina sediminis]|uniref:Flp family type IVb pilin n=1 Tax=Ovoidimarina sediminis TaxID=3079856 RepID=UPI00291216D4|nr:hypothetical protein [Rhodophyticola sp. MJ-SS7]MDU8942949.1 hypothetical protein [Rhodophyticola sp. MJ-SS7]